jgi:dipeptidyl aminopeptidase/acylaminoacyl peptidase
MLDNEDTPTTPRPSFPRDEHQPDDAISSPITTPAETHAPDAAQNGIADEPSTPDKTSIDANEPAKTEPTQEPHDESVADTTPEPATPELDTHHEEDKQTPEEQIPQPAHDEQEPANLPDATIQVPPTPTSPPATPASPPVIPVPSTRPYVTVEDLLALHIASDPQISPDGTLIAFTVQQCHAQTNSTSSAIWLARNSSDKNASPWQVSRGTTHDTQPRWSPDGHTLAFLSDRTGTNQIYLLPMQGGESRQLTTLLQGVSAYSWHPAGGTLLAHSPWKASDDQPKAEAQPDINVYTRLDAAHDGQGHRQGRHQQLWLIAMNGQEMRLTAEPVDLVQSCWSPDGTEIAFCANRRKDPDLNPGMALWVLTLKTGQFRRLTDEDGFAFCPSWSPDGQYIAYISTVDLTQTGNYAPWLVRVRGGHEAPRPAVPGAEQLTCQSWIIDELHEEWLQPPRWYPDSRALLVPVQEHGQIHLYKLHLPQSSSTRLTTNNGRYLACQLSHDGNTIVMIRADWFTPGDLWSMDGEGKNLRKLSGINDAFLQSHQLIRPRRITWQSFDNEEIEGWLYLPPLAPGAQAPLIIAPHGGPTLAWGDSYVHEFQVLAARGYAVLAPNIRGSAGYGEAFSRKTLNDWGGTDFRDLLLGIDYVSKTEPIDGARLGIGGMSYGGYLACWAISQTTRFKAAVSHNGFSSLITASLLSDHSCRLLQTMSDPALRQERSPLTFAEQISTPLLLLHAEDDLECPFSESQQLFITLRRRKQLVVLVSYPHASHLMDWPAVGSPLQRVDRLRRTVEWFERLV